MKFERITIDPGICTGKPCIRGLRFPVSRLLGLLAEGGEMTYFEYAGLQPLVALLFSAESRRRVKQVRRTAAVFRRRHDAQRELVLCNLPPAYAVRLRR